MEDMYTVSGMRTAISHLGSRVAAEAIARTGAAPSDVGHVVFGQVCLTSGKDAYLARACAINAEIPMATPALTVARLCGCGAESMSNYERARISGSYGLSTMCIGGGQGMAMEMERAVQP